VVVEEPARTRDIGPWGDAEPAAERAQRLRGLGALLDAQPCAHAQLLQLPNAAGNLVYPNETTIVSAITNHKGASTDLHIMLADGAGSYPMVTINAFMALRRRLEAASRLSIYLLRNVDSEVTRAANRCATPVPVRPSLRPPGAFWLFLLPSL
jgi:hypothetical protein